MKTKFKKGDWVKIINNFENSLYDKYIGCVEQVIKIDQAGLPCSICLLGGITYWSDEELKKATKEEIRKEIEKKVAEAL